MCRHVPIGEFRNRVCPLSVRTREKNLLSFVTICPAVVIDTSMERSSRVLATAYSTETHKFDFFPKRSKLNSDLYVDLG